MITQHELAPLAFPDGWPPRSVKGTFDGIPIIGGIVVWLRLLFARNSQAHLVEAEILRRLHRRPAWNVEWPTDPKGNAIVRALSRAVADEKLDRASVALHPDDPVVLLTWGAFDDLTPLLFQTRLARVFGLKKLPVELIDFLCAPGDDKPAGALGDERLRSRRTVRDLVDFYAQRLPELPDGAEDYNWGWLPWWDRIPSSVGFALLGLILGVVMFVITRL